MSISTQIDALTTDRNNIRAAIVAKGVAAASGHGFDSFAEDIAAIEQGGGGGFSPFTAIETGTMILSGSNSRPTVNFTNTHTDPPALVFLHDITGTASVQTNANYSFLLIDWEKIFGNGYPYDGTVTNFRAASAHYIYRGTSTTSTSVAGVQIRYGASKTGSSSTAYFRYWADATSFRPYSNSTSRIWVANRMHKWYALWV